MTRKVATRGNFDRSRAKIALLDSQAGPEVLRLLCLFLADEDGLPNRQVFSLSMLSKQVQSSVCGNFGVETFGELTALIFNKFKVQ